MPKLGVIFFFFFKTSMRQSGFVSQTKCSLSPELKVQNILGELV